MNANELCVSIFIKYIGWYLVVMGILHNEECHIYIFKGEVQYCTPNIFKMYSIKVG